ncbi:MAG: hypothetical protein V3S12_05300 [Acidiferrobacterales bacterium]
MKASDILGLKDLRTKVVDVPAWDCKLTIRELGLGDGLSLFALATSEDGKEIMDAEAIAQVVAWGVIDPDTGKRLFSDADVPALLEKSQKALLDLYKEIVNLSGGAETKNS